MVNMCGQWDIAQSCVCCNQGLEAEQCVWHDGTCMYPDFILLCQD